MRPPEGLPSCWYVCDYDDTVSTGKFRPQFPEIFATREAQPQTTPNESKRSPRKSDTPSEESDDTDDDKPPDDTAVATSATPPQEAEDTAKDKEKAPGDAPVISPVPTPQEDPIHREIEAQSPGSTGSYSAKYAAPRRHSSIQNDWYSQAWGGDWGEPWRPQSRYWHQRRWADAVDSSEADKTPRAPAESATAQTPTPAVVTDVPVTPSVTEIPAPVCESAKVQVAKTQTKNVTVFRDGGSGVAAPLSPLEPLNAMAARGPTLTYEDRIARQNLANGLTIPPEVYNPL